MALPNTGFATQSVTAGGALTDFTLIVDLSDMPADWWTENDTADGTKGRAAKDDETELATDWISFDNGASTGWLRVKWSGTLSAVTANTLRIYPPVAANSSNAASATYGSDNAYDSSWAMYLPLDEAVNNDVDGYVDRTSNGNHGQGVSMGETEVTGQIGNGQDFDGIVDHIATSNAVVSSTFTLSYWFQRRTDGDFQRYLGQAHAVNNTANKFRATSQPDNRQYLQMSNSAGTAFNTYTTNTVPAVVGTWDQYVTTFNGSTELKFYQNSILRSTSGTSGTFSFGEVLRVGGNLESTYWDSSLDEVILHSAVRSADWIEEEHSQTDDNATYWGGVWSWLPTFDIILADIVHIKQLASDTVNILQVASDTVNIVQVDSDTVGL